MSSSADEMAEVAPPTIRRVLVAASLGNFVEWFDFAVYGFMATVIARHFFPSENPTTGLLQTFAVFAVAFAARPLGAVVFGTLGDRIGRRKVLSLTVLLIGASTTTIGILPTYESIGVTATLLLCLARAVQGFSAGGEYAGACTYVIEHSPTGRRARYSSLLPASTFIAFAAAAGVSYAVAALLTDEALYTWGWRIPFLVAAPIGLLGFYIRHRLSETPAFQRLENSTDRAPESAPLRATLREQRRSMLVLGCVISASGLAFYTFTTYMSTYVQVVGGHEAPTALLASVTALTFAALLAPFAGMFSDRIGRRRTAVLAAILIGTGSIPAFLLAGHPSVWVVVAGQCLLAIGATLSLVVVAVLMSELFPTRVRYTASALTYNVAYTIFGGTAPFVATYLVSQTGNSLSPAFYLVAVSLLALVSALALPETVGRPLDIEPLPGSSTDPAAALPDPTPAREGRSA